MDLDTAKAEFLALFQALNTDGERSEFLSWLREDLLPAAAAECCPAAMPPGAVDLLDRIAAELRERLPREAVLPSERVQQPALGEDAGLDPRACQHLDGFLYDAEAEEQLVEEGLLSRQYCRDCGSRNTADLTLLTHSCSKERLQSMFLTLLPPLPGKHLVDVGSRLGAVLYGAYAFSAASRITGVEMNPELCEVQRAVIAGHGLHDRISLVEADINSQAELLSTADVIVLNNVFDWFMPAAAQVEVWQFLRSALPPGSLLVTIPALETSLGPLPTGIDLASWVRPVKKADQSDVESSEMCLYQVLAPAPPS